MRFTRFSILMGIIAIIFWAINFSVANEDRFVYDSKGKRDPFISLLGTNVKVTDVELLESIKDIRVEGVIIDSTGSAAIMNNNIVRLGEFIGGFKLTQVTNYRVILERNGKEHAIKFRDKDEY